MLAVGGSPPDAPVTFVVADLTSDTGWEQAVAGCAYVLHVASPFPATMPKNEDDFRDNALVLRARLGTAAGRVPTRTIPNWTLRLAAGVVPSLRASTGELGTVRASSNAKAKRVLGWTPRTNEEAIVATGERLMRLGFVGGATKTA